MSEQLNQMQSMLEQLIKMVGNNNASIEELRQDVTTLKQDVTVLKQDTTTLKQDIADLKQTTEQGFSDLVNMVNLLGEKTETIPRIEAKLDALNERIFEHEADIRLLKKAR